MPAAPRLRTGPLALAGWLLAGVAIAPPVHAQPAPAQPVPAHPLSAPQAGSALPGATPESRKEAQALVEEIHATDMVKTVLTAMRGVIVQMAARGSGKPEAEVAAVLDELVMPELQASAPDLATTMTEIWAADYTAQELRDLRAFYATPLGQKTLSLQPVIAQQSAAAGQAWGQRAVQSALQKHAQQLRERGLKF